MFIEQRSYVLVPERIAKQKQSIRSEKNLRSIRMAVPPLHIKRLAESSVFGLPENYLLINQIQTSHLSAGVATAWTG